MAARGLTPEVRLTVVGAEKSADRAVTIGGQERTTSFVETRRHAIVAFQLDHVAADRPVAQCLRGAKVRRHVEPRKLGTVLFEMLDEVRASSEARRSVTRRRRRRSRVSRTGGRPRLRRLRWSVSVLRCRCSRFGTSRLPSGEDRGQNREQDGDRKTGAGATSGGIHSRPEAGIVARLRCDAQTTLAPNAPQRKEAQ